MKRIIFLILAVIAVSIMIFAVVITRDGELVIPQGKGIVTLDVGEFEAFPLPDYAAKHVTNMYKSYFVEVEPGIKDVFPGQPIRYPVESQGRHEPLKVEKWIETHAIPVIEHDEGAVADWPESNH